MNRNQEQELFNTISDLYDKVYDQIKESEEHKLNYSAYDLGLGDIINEAITESLISLLNSEKLQNKITETATKQLLTKDRNKRKEYREYRRKQLALWKATKGIIPCLNQCGYTKQYTKDEVMHNGCNYLCKECAEKTEDPFDIFDKTNIYKLFNIE